MVILKLIFLVYLLKEVKKDISRHRPGYDPLSDTSKMDSRLVDQINQLARKDGLVNPVNIWVSKSEKLGKCFYHPRLNSVATYSYSNSWVLGASIAHEVWHAIDYHQKHWAFLIPYRPLFYSISIISGIIFGPLSVGIAYFIAYALHPLEFRANIYALRHSKKYQEIIKPFHPDKIILEQLYD